LRKGERGEGCRKKRERTRQGKGEVRKGVYKDYKTERVTPL